VDLKTIRQKIDTVDSAIIQLLSQRAELVSAAGMLKKDEQGVRDPNRVEQVILKVRTVAVEAGLAPDIAETIYRTIINCFIAQELKEFNGKKQDAISVYGKRDLVLKPSVPGAMMWAVGLKKSMLTYFEMEANTVFPDHSHEAEQITLVLEGKLTFTYDGKTSTLLPGDAIAIPSNIRHAVSTGTEPCKTVDAWSPMRQEYISN
jgi:isochorismate pyruvate lyase